MKLTEQAVRGLSLEAGQTDRVDFDSDIPGFGVRLREGGSRNWIFQYKIGTKQRRMVLGKTSALTAIKARESASKLHAKVKLGGDPAAERELSIANARDTFGSIVTRYLAVRQLDLENGTMRARSLAEVTRHLNKNLKPLHGHPFMTVDQRTIAERLSALAEASGNVTANRTRASVSKMYRWAMGEGIALTNPVANTPKRKEKSRERVLSEAELRLIWNALEDDHYGTIVKLLMLTGQRENEIAALEHSELDFKEELIHLPGSRTKNKKPHDLPMSKQVRALLKAQKQIEGRAFVFGYRDGPFSGFSKSKTELDERLKEANGDKVIPHWTLHDLRRTAATMMAERLEIEPHIVEAILNHVSGHKGGVAGIYNRARYLKPMAAALTAWDAHLAAVIEKRASNVTALRRA